MYIYMYMYAYMYVSAYVYECVGCNFRTDVNTLILLGDFSLHLLQFRYPWTQFR